MHGATHTFRVFVSSTFEDLKAERNALQKDVWPRLRALCERNGARFQAIDLRWGIRDEAALDQRTMEICLREIERCKETRIKPNFIVLLGDRYGWLPLPARIPAAELDPTPVAGDWYRLDENADPPEYVLQPRTGIFTNPDLWGVIEESLHKRLEAAARAAGVQGKALEKYMLSATHQEIVAGLGENGENEEERRHVFGFFREKSPATDGRLEAVQASVPNSTQFAAGNTQALCDAVYARLSGMIEKEVKGFQDVKPQDAEIREHNCFAADRSRIFHGRRRELDAIQEYLANGERRPLVVHGPSGAGKSALMAKASLAYEGTSKVLRRFIAATPDSSSGHGLLASLCRELAPGEDVPVDFAQLQQAFQQRLAGAAPAVLFIDALDQLAAGDPARSLACLPRELPPGVKVLISTTPEAGRLPAGVPLRVEPMAVDEAGDALDELLRDTGRKLQPRQRARVLDAFGRCGLPLYLKLAAEEARLWPSYAADADCRVGDGVARMLDLLFERLAGPAGHSTVLVERSLGYLAAARYGLTEDEILEVLTADDAVWQDFDRHKHHAVEGRQLPVVVWSRLRSDVDPYLTERASPGGTVAAFYHRQLAERAAIDQETRHADLATYFQKQPAWLDEGKRQPNARRSAELPFQQRVACDWDAAEATLRDAGFLLAKCAAGLAQDLETDYWPVLTERPGETLRLIHGAVRLSMHVLARDPAQFASQMVGRLLAHRERPGGAAFVDEVTAAAPRPWLRPLHPCFDAPGGSLLRTLAGHSIWVRGVAVTPDGKRAVSASWDRTLKVWDIDTGGEERTLAGHSASVECVAVTPDGKRAISASGDHTLRVWDLESGSEVRTLGCRLSSPQDVAVTPDGKRAVFASDNGLRVWDLETWRILRTLAGHSAGVNGVAVTPDGKLAVSASDDKTLKVWNLESGSEVRTLAGHSGVVNGVAVTPDGKRAVSASWDKTLKVWDLEAGGEALTLAGHSDCVFGVAVTPDGRRAVSASRDKTLKVWDLESGVELRTLAGHSGYVVGVAVTPDGKRAVSASQDNTLKVWNLEGEGAVRPLAGHSGPVNGVAVTTDGRRAVSASWDKTLKVWDFETGGEARTLAGHSHHVFGVAVTPDGKRAVSASRDKTLKVWDLESGGEVRTLAGHSNVVGAVDVTPDGQRVVSASWDTTLKVWDLESGRAVRTLAGHSKDVFGVAVTPDGRRAVSASWDKTLKVWDLESGRAVRTLVGHSDLITGVAVTPDGKRAVSASTDKTLKVWDLKSGRALRTLAGHSDQVLAVAVTPDGKRVVSASFDKTLKTWELSTGQCITTFRFDGLARACACNDAHRIVAGDDAGRVYFLALEE